jgi:hypothetical protein
MRCLTVELSLRRRHIYIYLSGLAAEQSAAPREERRDNHNQKNHEHGYYPVPPPPPLSPMVDNLPFG